MIKMFFLVNVVLAIIGCSESPKKSKPVVVDSVKEVDTDEVLDTDVTSNILVNKIGDIITFGNYTIKILRVVNVSDNSEFASPEIGNMWISMEVEYQNNTLDQIIGTNPLDWKIFDGEGYSYGVEIMSDGKTPELDAVDVRPGNKVRGWITFEIPKKAVATMAQFSPEIGGSSIDIQLN